MRVITLFCGGGTADLHSPPEAEHVAAFDYWEPAIRTYNLNHGGAAELADLAKEVPEVDGGADVLWTSPPRIDFSPARGAIPKTGTSGLYLTSTVEALDKYQPDYLVVENHTSALNSLACRELLRELGRRGFNAQTFRVDEAKIGGRSNRKRGFILASKRYRGMFQEPLLAPAVKPWERFKWEPTFPLDVPQKSERTKQALEFIRRVYGHGTMTYNGELGLHSWEQAHSGLGTHPRHMYVSPEGSRLCTPEDYAWFLGCDRLEFPEDLSATARFRIIGNGVGAKTAQWAWQEVLK